MALLLKHNKKKSITDVPFWNVCNDENMGKLMAY